MPNSQKGFIHVIFFLVIILISALIIGDSFYVKKFNPQLLTNLQHSGAATAVSQIKPPDLVQKSVASPPPVKAVSKITKLYTMPDPPIVATRMVFSSDHKHFLYFPAGKHTFNHDGQFGDSIGETLTDPILSGDGTAVAYIAYDPSQPNGQKKYYGVINGQKTQTYDDIYIVPNPANNTFAYTIKQNGKSYAVINGQIGNEYQDIPEGITFSPDGRQWAYEVKVSDSEELMVLNGKEGKIYSRVQDPKFSADGKNFIYEAVGCGQGSCLVVNGQETQSYNSEANMVPRFSPNGQYFVSIGYSQSNDRTSYYLFLNGKQLSKEYLDIRDYSVSNNGKVIFSATTLDNKQAVVFDGKEIDLPANTHAAGLAISNDGSRYAYGVVLSAASSLEDYYVIDGQPTSKYGSIDDYLNYNLIVSAGGLQFSPDNKHYIYSIGGTSSLGVESALDIDGREDKIYQYQSSIDFSSDGQSVTYNGVDGNDILLVLQSLESPDVPEDPEFNSTDWQTYNDTKDQVIFKIPKFLKDTSITNIFGGGDVNDVNSANYKLVLLTSFSPEYFRLLSLPQITYFVRDISNLDTYQKFIQEKDSKLVSQSGETVTLKSLDRKQINGHDFLVNQVVEVSSVGSVNLIYYSFSTKSGRVGTILFSAAQDYPSDKFTAFQQQLLNSIEF